MNLLTIAQRIAGKSEERAITYDTFMSGLGLSSSHSAAGYNVTPEKALENSTVMACVRILSEGVATLPMDAAIRSRGVRQPYRRPEWLGFEQGPFTKQDIISQMMVSLLLRGNAYIATYRDGEANVSFMEVLDPDRVTPVRISSAEVQYDLRTNSGVTRLTKDDILHIRGLSLPGELEGISVISYMKETVGISLGSQEFGAAFYGNGALPGAIIEVPGQLSPTGRSALKEGFNDLHRGAGNAHKLAVLTEGAKFSKVTLTPDEAQFLETRKFQVNDIARIFGVPVNLLQHSDGPEMGQSLSDKNTHYVQHTLRPWVERIESALTWLMHSEGNPRQSFIKFNLDGLMRGDHATRFATYNTSVVNAILTINEVRAMEDMPPVPWGDEPQSVQVQPDANADPDPAPDPDPDPDTEENENE